MDKTEKRGKIDIQIAILKEAKEEAGKSRLVYRCNLNFNVIKGYLTELINAGLLEQIGARYYTTEKGGQFVAAYEKLKSIWHGQKLYAELMEV